MTYSTTPGTIAHRVVELLRGQPAGTMMSAGQICDELQIEPTGALRPCIEAAVRNGAIVATPSPYDGRRHLYSLPDPSAPKAEAAPADVEEDDADKAPLTAPVEGVPAAPSSVFALGAAAEVGATFPALTPPASAPKPKRVRKPKAEAPSTSAMDGVDIDAVHALEQADVIRCAPGYASLADVLNRAFYQAARGKGSERHAQGQPFYRQPMQDLIRLHGVGFATGQASKKAQESHRLPRDRAVAELLGAINYLAGAIIAIEAGGTNHTTESNA